MDANSVVRLRDTTFEFRLTGLVIRIPQVEALPIFFKGLTLCGYTSTEQLGLRVGDSEPKPMQDQHELRDAIERLRASGKALNVSTQTRPILLGPWADPPPPRPANAPPQRRFVKDIAKAAPAPAKSPPAKKTKTLTETVNGSWAIHDQLFADAREQLRYEVRHAYLMTVPLSQRDEWPLPQQYELMDSFMRDIDEQVGAVSRPQIISAIVDVVSGRMNDVNSRRPRPLREGGGDDGRPVITRTFDGAVAWRANVSTGTPAARRIMWWRLPDATVQLTRFSTHDDIEMPER